MKKTIKFLFAIAVLFVFTNTINAQSTLSINKYGTYIVQNNIAKEIQTEYTIGVASFWEKYLYLEGESTLGCCIYNIETESITNWIWGHVLQIIGGNNLFVYIYLSWPYDPNPYWIYELEPNTLEVINKVKLDERPFPDLQMTSYFYNGEYLQRTIEEKKSDRLYRYRGDNFYLDINYGPDIDLTGNYLDYLVNGGKDNIFIVRIHKVEFYK